MFSLRLLQRHWSLLFWGGHGRRRRRQRRRGSSARRRAENGERRHRCLRRCRRLCSRRSGRVVCWFVRLRYDPFGVGGVRFGGFGESLCAICKNLKRRGKRRTYILVFLLGSLSPSLSYLLERNDRYIVGRKHLIDAGNHLLVHFPKCDFCQVGRFADLCLRSAEIFELTADIDRSST